MGVEYVLREENTPQGDWLTRLLASGPPSYSFELAPRDEAGARALSELKDKGINLVANALAQSADHVVSFFTMLRVELAFYVGCLNLAGTLTARATPVCFPEPASPEEHRHSAAGLYDVCLALNLGRPATGNTLGADNKSLVIITGANQGGKSTFLRSIGLAQLMMQCGLFVPADTFQASICGRILTHYKREEDVKMKSGKFDEELSRMSAIVDDIVPRSLVLLNESFAATNEREGSDIARQIVIALIEHDVRVFFVTHMYELAHCFEARDKPGLLLLRAERREDGARTFKIKEGEPLRTSHGKDLYRRIFLGEAAA
jgi:DNA mismatch repair ATPase MutS